MTNFCSLWKAYLKGYKNYYGNQADITHLFGNSNELNANNCKEFIYRYFETGQKTKAFDIPFSDVYSQFGKHVHTVSLYLLGCVLEKSFSIKVHNAVKHALDSECDWYEDDDFCYSWFLACLYHDVASSVETRVLPLVNERQKHLDYYCGKWNIKYTPYNHQPVNPSADINCYSENLIKNYFYYMSNKGEIDHGIIGGYLLFDRMKKNFISFTNGENVKEKVVITKVGNRLIKWNIEHPDHFAYVADAIICHNLWTCNYGHDSTRYEQYGLDPLIIKSNCDKVSIEKYPLQFMLRLLDSLEPTKRFESMQTKKVLQNVFISEDCDNMRITIGWSPFLCYEEGFKRWYKTISGLSNWMNVRISDVHKNENLYSVDIDLSCRIER